jgi:hypothetical protein
MATMNFTTKPLTPGLKNGLYGTVLIGEVGNFHYLVAIR